MRLAALLVVVSVVLGSGCNCDGGQTPDGGETPDSGAPDAGRPDAGTADAGEVDAGPPVSLVPIGNELGEVLSTGTASKMTGAQAAILPDGGLVVAHRPPPGDFVVLSRHEPGSGLWEPVTEGANQRPATTTFDLAVDGTGAPLLAVVQLTQADATRAELLLLRFTTSWQPVQLPLLLAGQRLGDLTQGTLLLDRDQRPLLTFADSNDSNVQVLRSESGGGYTTLGFVELAYDPQLTLDVDGAPLLAYLKGTASSNAAALQVARVGAAVDGGLVQLGATVDSVPNATQSIGWPRAAVLDGTRWVFWTKNGIAHGASFDGGAWGETDFGEATPTAFGVAAVAVGHDLLLAMCSDDFTNLKRYHAGAWEPSLRVPVSQRCYLPSFAVQGSTVVLVTSGTNIAQVWQVLLRP